MPWCTKSRHRTLSSTNVRSNLCTPGHVSSDYIFDVAYGIGKAAMDRMANDMAIELATDNVTMISLWPGIVATESPGLHKEEAICRCSAGACVARVSTFACCRHVAKSPKLMSESHFPNGISNQLLGQEYVYTMSVDSIVTLLFIHGRIRRTSYSVVLQYYT